jgi:thiol-disulfide isomerase/thioredoxin
MSSMSFKIDYLWAILVIHLKYLIEFILAPNPNERSFKSWNDSQNGVTNMALCCIGGVCIPYSAILPLLIISLQWLLRKLAAAGLLPDAASQFLARVLPTQKATGSACSGVAQSDACCSVTASNNVRRGKHSKREDSTVSLPNDGTVHTIASEGEWSELLALTKSLSTSAVIVCKFTAKWCKPCREIAPLFDKLAAETATNASSTSLCCRFVSMDVDDLDEIAATYKVMTLPTFVALSTSTSSTSTMTVLGRYTGSSPDKLREFVQSVVLKVD